MKIVFYGDSITDMDRNREKNSSSPFAFGSGYPFLINSRLSEENPQKHILINNGISGNRVVDLYARIKADVWNLQPDVLSILIGINDIWHELYGENGVDIKRFERVYRTIIEETKERLPNIKIMLLEPFVLKASATAEKYEGFLEVKEYSKVVKKLADEYNLTFVPLQYKFDELSEKYGVETYLYDGVHPSIAGSTLIANEWLKAFKEKVEK